MWIEITIQLKCKKLISLIFRCSDLLQGCAIDDTSNVTKSLSSNKLPHSASGTSLASPTTPTSNPFIDVTRGLTLTKVPGSPQKSSDLPKLQNYGAIPSINDYFDVRITMSANPSNFTVIIELICHSFS